MRQSDHLPAVPSSSASGAAGEKTKCILEFLTVCILVVGVSPCVEFESADGEEGLVGRIAIGVGVEDRCELLEFGWSGRYTESAVS